MPAIPAGPTPANHQRHRLLRRNHSGLRRTKGSNARSSGSKRSPARYSRGESIPTLATGIVLGAHTFHSLSVKEGGNRTKHDCLPLWLWQGSFFLIFKSALNMRLRSRSHHAAWLFFEAPFLRLECSSSSGCTNLLKLLSSPAAVFS